MYSTSLIALLPFASATTLFVASYAGTITSLSLTESYGKYAVSNTSVSNDCAPNPSWLTLDAGTGQLFCLNEGLVGNGSLSSFTINPNGSLNHVQNTTTITGPVSGVIYGNPAGQRAIALAHYGPTAGVSSFTLNGAGKFTSNNQNITFTLDKPGPVADRQASPHEHEAILDPTGQYILVPDLGADLVRVFAYNDDLSLKPLGPLKVGDGDGPRHAVFYNPYGAACENCTTFMYVVNELAATIRGYSVSYLPNKGGLNFKEVYSSPTYGNIAQPAGNAPSEISISVSHV